MGWCTQLSGTKLHAGPNEAGKSRFFYHANCAEPGITGIAKISREAYPDHTAFNPKDKHYDPKSDPDMVPFLEGYAQAQATTPITAHRYTPQIADQ